MTRALQSLVIARDRILAPEFCSIEEYLGDNTQDYYDAGRDISSESRCRPRLGGFHGPDHFARCQRSRPVRPDTLRREAPPLPVRCSRSSTPGLPSSSPPPRTHNDLP